MNVFTHTLFKRFFAVSFLIAAFAFVQSCVAGIESCTILQNQKTNKKIVFFGLKHDLESYDYQKNKIIFQLQELFKLLKDTKSIQKEEEIKDEQGIENLLNRIFIFLNIRKAIPLLSDIESILQNNKKCTDFFVSVFNQEKPEKEKCCIIECNKDFFKQKYEKKNKNENFIVALDPVLQHVALAKKNNKNDNVFFADIRPLIGVCVELVVMQGAFESCYDLESFSRKNFEFLKKILEKKIGNVSIEHFNEHVQSCLEYVRKLGKKYQSLSFFKDLEKMILEKAENFSKFVEKKDPKTKILPFFMLNAQCNKNMLFMHIKKIVFDINDVFDYQFANAGFLDAILDKQGKFSSLCAVVGHTHVETIIKALGQVGYEIVAEQALFKKTDNETGIRLDIGCDKGQYLEVNKNFGKETECALKKYGFLPNDSNLNKN